MDKENTAANLSSSVRIAPLSLSKLIYPSTTALRRFVGFVATICNTKPEGVALVVVAVVPVVEETLEVEVPLVPDVTRVVVLLAEVDI